MPADNRFPPTPGLADARHQLERAIDAELILNSVSAYTAMPPATRYDEGYLSALIDLAVATGLSDHPTVITAERARADRALT